MLLGAVAAFSASRSARSAPTGCAAGCRRSMMAVFQTGVQYHMYHALALLLVSRWHWHGCDGWLLRTAGWLFLPGSCSSRAASMRSR